MAETATITIPSAAQQLKAALNSTLGNRHGSVDVGSDQKFAVVFIPLVPAVTQADYPALKAAIEAIAGIQPISLLIDGQMPTIPAELTASIKVNAQMRLADITPPE
jgi:hypothetical protein